MEDGAFWISTGAIFFLLCCSAFFSGSETALTAASRARMHSLEKGGDPRAGLVNRLREKKERLIGALLLGNNLVNILASALATSVLIKMFGEAGVAYATLGMTLLVLIFAEVLPKTYALNNADSMARTISPVIRVIVAVFGPITDAITRIVWLTMRIIGIDPKNFSVGGHLEELIGVIELHGEDDEGEGTVEERAMLRSILDLTNVDVEEIMIHRRNVAMIDIDDGPEEIIDQVLDSPYTRLPVFQDDPDNIIGVLHTKWVLRELRHSGGDIGKVDFKAATLEPWFVPESTKLYDQMQQFRSRREHFALVVDEYGSLMGIVTLEDILEEIVGEIADENDIAVTGVRPQPDGSYLIDGKVTIRDLNREFEWRLPDDEYATVAGLVIYESQSIPNLGQNFTFFGFRFEIMRRQRNQISLVRVIPPAAEDDEEEGEAA